LVRAVALPLALIAFVAVATGAAATPGPGGWDNLGTGPAGRSALNGTVNALDASGPGVVHAGGAFTDAGGDPNADYIASWAGGSWKALGSPTLNGAVFALASKGGKVYAGGVFTNAGGDPDADFLAAWDGTKWGTVCKATGPAITGNVSALQIVGSTIYVGGSFQNGAGIASADYLLACDLATGAPRSTVARDGEFSGTVYALTADSRGTLYAGGGFINLGNVAADHVAYLDGSGWHALGAGTGAGGPVDTFVRSLASSGASVYVGTDSVDVAGIPQADHVVKWNGSAWSAMGSNAAGADGWFPASSSINALTSSGSRVFAGGSFQNANGDALADFVAYFDGSAWHPIGTSVAGNGSLQGQINALAVSGGQLYAGGNFSNAGGNALADAVASFALVNLTSAGGGGVGGGGTTTPPGSTPPATGTATGAVTVNGKAFKSGRIPYNAKVDVTRGVLLLETGTGSVRLYGSGVPARFQLLRGTDDKKPIVELRLIGGDFSACKRTTKSVSRGAAPKTVRQLWGSGKGKFRTRGRYAAATVRGTFWLTADRCDGTLTRVRQGIVRISDLRLKKEVTLRAGRTYLAKP
jgi:hypothetical protein